MTASTKTTRSRQKRRQQESPTMDVSETIQKSSNDAKIQPTCKDQPSLVVDEQTEKKCFRVEEYPEAIGKLIKELAMQEAVAKSKEEAISKWSKAIADAKKAHESGLEADTEQWQKVLDDATKANAAKRQEEMKKWQKVKDDATAKRQSQFISDQALWRKVQEDASTSKQKAKAEKMLRELEASHQVPTKEIKKADKILSQLAKDEDSSEMKQAKKMLLRAKQGNAPSNEMKRAEKKLKQLQGDLTLVQAKVAETKQMIRRAAASADLKSLFADEEEEEEEEREMVEATPPADAAGGGDGATPPTPPTPPTPAPAGASYEAFPTAATTDEKDEEAVDEFIIEQSATTVTDANCNSRLASQCAPLSVAWSHLMKKAAACNPTACFDVESAILINSLNGDLESI